MWLDFKEWRYTTKKKNNMYIVLYELIYVIEEKRKGTENKEGSWRSYIFKQSGPKCITLKKIFVLNYEVCDDALSLEAIYVNTFLSDPRWTLKDLQKASLSGVGETGKGWVVWKVWREPSWQGIPAGGNIGYCVLSGEARHKNTFIFCFS